MSSRTPSVMLGTLLAFLFTATTPVAALQVCDPVDPIPSTEQVLPGVTLTWDSSFLCANARDADEYEFTVTVTNAETSVEAVIITAIPLVSTTPRPRGRDPNATGGTADVPQTIRPGGSADFVMTGEYELVMTDEGNKVNLHFQTDGEGETSGELFSLGINAHFHASGAAAE